MQDMLDILFITTKYLYTFAGRYLIVTQNHNLIIYQRLSWKTTEKPARSVVTAPKPQRPWHDAAFKG